MSAVGGRSGGFFEPSELELIQVGRPADEGMRRLTGDEFRDVIGSFASGVTVITALHRDLPFGTTASAVSSLSLEPPMLLVCMNKESSTGQAIHAARLFAVNILSEDQPDAAVRFASKDADKFNGIAVTPGQWGEPLLEQALAHLECRVVEEVTGGTHWVFLAEVDRASAREGAPLAYFRGEFGRLELAQDEGAYRELRGLLFARDLPIDEPLGLDQLADQLGRARGPVYHALAKLSGEGLVTRDTGGAFVVPPVTREVVEDALRARRAIMLGVAELTLGKLSGEQLAELRRRFEALPSAETEGREAFEAWVNAFPGFLEHVVGLGGSATLSDAFRRANTPAMMLAGQTENRRPESFARDCAELVEAYERDDLDAAQRAIRRLFEDAAHSSERLFSSQDEI